MFVKIKLRLLICSLSLYLLPFLTFSYGQDLDPLPIGPVTGANGSTYTEITQIIDGPQARAFFNTARNKLVIAFTGTEGAQDLNAAEFLPDLVTNFTLAVSGTGSQGPIAEAIAA